jgi:hypothetical protein
MVSAKELAEATAKLVEAAKLCAVQLNDKSWQVSIVKKEI